MSDIPGFTPEQAYILDSVAERAARRVLDDFKKAGGCPFACDDMADVKSTVYGNGHDGLKTRVTRLESEMQDVVWTKRASLAAALSAAGALIVSLWR